jgi:hypothetical protein
MTEMTGMSGSKGEQLRDIYKKYQVSFEQMCFEETFQTNKKMWNSLAEKCEKVIPHLREYSCTINNAALKTLLATTW